MYTKLIASAAVAAALFSVPAMAEDNDGAVTGAAGGAVTGAIVGGPVGAVVGGAVGVVAGATLDPPPREVVTYVEQQPLPAEPVVVEEVVEVGKPLPKTVVLTPIPEDPAYAYTVVNEKRVIVDPKTYTVVQVVE
jgi:phage tail tape-measure protein